MITCPNCQHIEPPGTLFCSNCGAQLVSSDPFGTQSIQKTPSDYFDTKISFDPAGIDFSDMQDMSEPNITLRIVDHNQFVQLTGQMEFTVGRAADGQPVQPDVDLNSYDAYSMGVSRLHAVLKILPNRIVVMDLGSSNGTRVNGQKIVPHVDYPLNLGDIVALGKLKIQVVSQQTQS